MSFQNRKRLLEEISDPIHEYFDINVVHQNSDNTPVQLKFNETRNAPYIMSPEKYFMSIVRFNVSTQLPVFIPKIKLNQPNPVLLQYKMWLLVDTFSNNYIPFNFTWVPQGNATAPRPDSGNIYTYQNITESDFYYCYSYQYFLNLLNKQIQNLSMQAGLNLWFSFDRATGNLKINYSKVSASPIITGSTVIHIVMNGAMKNLFELFPFINLNPSAYVGVFNEPVYLIDHIYNNGEVISSTTPTTIETDGCCFANWNPVSSVVFTSTTLPVIPSQQSTPVVFGSNANIGNSTSNNNIASVVTDFTVSIGPNSFYTPEIDYIPTAEYRLNDMMGKKELSNIDLQVWWKDKYGNLNPLLIPSGGKASIKVLFRKKTFNNISNASIN